ncbi:MAG: saccharopine dehydrogenase, partial [Bacteroidetes bacterium]
MKIIVLGAGLIGGPMAIDLAKDPRFEVTLTDRDPASLAELGTKFPIVTLQRDLSDPVAIRDLVKDYDIVVNALPGFMGY